MKWAGTVYGVHLLTSAAAIPELCRWEHWQKAFPIVDRLMTMSPATAAIRTGQTFDNESHWLGFGRMIWSRKNNEKCETTPSASSAPVERRGASESSMNKANRHNDNDLRPEYDFASMKGGVRGKYVARLRKGSNLVLLDPEVAAAFPSDDAVNEALRGVLNTTRAVRGKGGLPNKALQPTSRAASPGKKPGRAGAARG